jgi:hypothetical protein
VESQKFPLDEILRLHLHLLNLLMARIRKESRVRKEEVEDGVWVIGGGLGIRALKNLDKDGLRWNGGRRGGRVMRRMMLRIERD